MNNSLFVIFKLRQHSSFDHMPTSDTLTFRKNNMLHPLMAKTGRNENGNIISHFKIFSFTVPYN